MFWQYRSRSVLALLLLLLGALLLATVAGSVEARPPAEGERLTVGSIEPLGLVTFSTGYTFAGTEVGGLSGLAYDAHRDVYYIISDDKDDPRYYTVEIDLDGDGSLDPGDVTFVGVTFLRNQQNRPFPEGYVDAESIVMTHPGQLYISSEGNLEVDPPVDPFVNRFNTIGKQNRALPVPDKFLPGGVNQVRDNLAFESLTATPNLRHLYTATENALEEDGPEATVTTGSPARVLAYDLRRKQPGPEYVYHVAPIPEAPVPPTAFADNGLVELEALDNHGTFLAMERSFAVGVGNIVRLFETSTAGATDVSGFTVLPPPGAYDAMSKVLVADFEDDLGIDPDNLEGMRFGPTLPDGRRLLIVVSDNNFRGSQTTQFIALAVELEPAE